MNVVGLVPFSILPAHFGGAERCWNVLSRLGPISVRALSWGGDESSQQIGNVNYQVVAPGQDAIDHAVKMRQLGVATFDSMPHLARKHLTNFAESVKDLEPDLVILEHPWLIDFIPDGVPFVYDAHNAETQHFATQFGTMVPDYLHVKTLERRAVTQAELVTYCSQSDAQALRNQYGAFQGIHVPNGVTLPDVTDREPEKMLLFIGSFYGPNVQAAQWLADLATDLPDYRIVIAGGCSQAVKTDATNVELLGPVNDEILHDLFMRAGIFVNLMASGSGTHLKVGRALSYGVPVVTTQIGARGYSTPVVTSVGDAIGAIEVVFDHYEDYSVRARREAESLEWSAVMGPLRNWVEHRR